LRVTIPQSITQYQIFVCGSGGIRWLGLMQGPFLQFHLRRSMAGVDQLIAHNYRGFPYILFDLIHHPDLADNLLNRDACTRDTFTESFLAVWNTAEKLRSTECRAGLFTLAVLLRVEITRVECRHAYIRRLLRSRNQAPGQRLEETSAHFTLMRQRCLEKVAWPFSKRLARKKPGPKRRKHVRTSGKFCGGKAGGGGLQRAGLSEVLKELSAGGKHIGGAGAFCLENLRPSSHLLVSS
jgi:hypothetical protein